MDTQACIVGGGPAGMVAGWLLARAGVDVIVLEKHRDFLRDFRGDTIHPSTLEMMYELGVLDEFLALPHTRQDRLQLDLMGELIAGPDFTHVPTHCKFIAFMPQWDFLRFVEREARQYKTFHLRMETEATGVIAEGEQVRGVRTKSDEEIRATLVIGADGRHSVIRTGLPLRELSVPIDVLWMRLPRKPSDGDALFGVMRADQFLVMIDRGDYWQCAYLIKKGSLDDIKAAGLPAFHARLTAIAPALADRIPALTWDDLKLLSVTVDRLERWWRPGLVCIGDAAHAMSPVGGVGINLAIQDAIAAANALWKPLRAGAVPERVLASIQRRRSLPTSIVQTMQTQLHERLLAPVLEGHGGHAVRGARHAFTLPFVPRLMARLVGVGFRRERVHTPTA